MIMIMTDLHEELIIAGFGGQGVILAGKLLSHTAMNSGKEVTYMPSYGAEVRGGTANCTVIIADQKIASPMTVNPDTAIVMNKASFAKFAPKVKSGGLLILNSSLIENYDKSVLAKDVEVLELPADDIAVELGNQKSANMVAVGAYLGKKKILQVEDAVESLANVLAKRYHNMLKLNSDAILKGAEFANGTSGN